MLHDIAAELNSLGYTTDFVAEDGPLPASMPERVLLGPKTPAWIEWATRCLDQGSQIAPDPQLVRLTRDRMQARELLGAAGFRTPQVISGTPSAILRHPELDAFQGPAVIKERTGHGRSIWYANSATEIASRISTLDAAVDYVVEEAVTGQHATAYYLGPRIEMFGRPPFAGEGSEFPLAMPGPTVSGALRRLQAATGSLFGKVDVVLSHRGDAIAVDLGVFPKFAHVWEAAATLAEVIATGWQQDEASTVERTR